MKGTGAAGTIASGISPSTVCSAAKRWEPAASARPRFTAIPSDRTARAGTVPSTQRRPSTATAPKQANRKSAAAALRSHTAGICQGSRARSSRYRPASAAATPAIIALRSSGPMKSAV
jgi:hypothetical protein